MGFQLVPKLVTLNGEMALILPYFTEFGNFRSILRKWLPKPELWTIYDYCV